MAELNDLMDFDHVIRVDENGNVRDDVDRSKRENWAPEVYSETVHPVDIRHAVAPDGWEWMNGYSCQDGYSGPIMHPSEFIGGGLARDILAEPGVYVAVVIDSLPEDEDGESVPDGWGVLRKVDA